MSVPVRNAIRQDFVSYSLAVGVAAVALAQPGQQANLQAYYTTFVVSVPVGGNPVFIGGANVLAASGNGIQVPAGVPMGFTIEQVRQLYEVQGPLTQAFRCAADQIPISVWDTSTIFLASAAPQTVGIWLLPEGFV